MPSIIERIQAKLELLRLEKRYTRSRRRRSTFVSNAVYVDGEYVYQTPASTGSSSSTASAASWSHGSTGSSSNRSNAVNALHHHQEPSSPAEYINKEVASKDKKNKRLSAMPGFGSGSGPQMAASGDWR